MCLLAAHQLNVEVVCVSIRGADFYFRFLYNIIMAAAVSWVDSGRVIFKSYFLSLKSQSRQIILLLLDFFGTYTFKNSTESQNLWHRGFISPKAILVLIKYVLSFLFYAIV